MVTYSSYLGKNVSLPKSAATIAVMNIFVSVMAGLVIFPVVFVFGYEPAEGPGLLFIVLPQVFSHIAFGEFFLSLFLFLFLFATVTSSISLLEIVTAAFTEKRKYSRKPVAWTAGIAVFIAGIPAALSAGVLSDVTLFGKTVFELTDYFVSNILLRSGTF